MRARFAANAGEIPIAISTTKIIFILQLSNILIFLREETFAYKTSGPPFCIRHTICLFGPMPRKLLVRSDCYPYHVTGRANNKEAFPLELDRLWRVMTEELLLLTLLYEVQIHAFVLMPNHFHLILSVPNTDLGKIMNLLLSSVTKRVNRMSGRSGHLFGGPYFWSIITSSRYYGHVFKYVARNPVKAKLSSHVEEYRFSTISGLTGQIHLPFPISYTKLGMEINTPEIERMEMWLYWLNQPFSTENEKCIQKILRKKEIKELFHRNTNRPLEALETLL